MQNKNFNHITPIQIRFNDIDGQQHVNNSIYQQYYDIGRIGYFTTIRRENYQTGGQSVVIASINTDFLKPIFPHDSVQVETRVEKIGEKSLTLFQRLVNSETGEVMSTCTTIFGGFDYEKQVTIPISGELRRLIEDFESGK